MVEYIAGSSDLQRNEGLPISHSDVTICGVSLYLWYMKPTRLRKRNLNQTHPAFHCNNGRIHILKYLIGAHLHTLPWRYKFIEGIWYDISRNPTKTLLSMKVSPTRNITHRFCVYNLATSFNRRPVSRAATVLASYWAPCLNIIVLFRIHAPVKNHYWSNHPISTRWSLRGHTAS